MPTSLRTIAHLSVLLGFLFISAACKEAQAKTEGVGDALQPFIVMNCESGERYCQVCAYSGKPKIMIVADVEDKAVESDLTRIQKMVEEHGDKGLVAFALFGKIENGKFSPVAEDAQTAARLNELRERLKLTYPVTLVPSKYTEGEKRGYAAFVDAYRIPTSRRVLYADAGNKVVFAETILDAQAQKQFEKLEAELAKL